MQSNYFCRTPLESSSVFWKSGENFNLEELTNPMLVGNTFTENFTAGIAVELSETFKTISTAASLYKFINYC